MKSWDTVTDSNTASLHGFDHERESPSPEKSNDVIDAVGKVRSHRL